MIRGMRTEHRMLGHNNVRGLNSRTLYRWNASVVTGIHLSLSLWQAGVILSLPKLIELVELGILLT